MESLKVGGEGVDDSASRCPTLYIFMENTNLKALPHS